ncbi:hypothetical protein LCGC14_1849930 [marine sediment metagenome]|uniref:Uncharacterized protein n=1 Tax=marine sediment metagenome TaxID=412755 RepID=A0A0F9GAL9_9ZZZZ
MIKHTIPLILIPLIFDIIIIVFATFLLVGFDYFITTIMGGLLLFGSLLLFVAHSLGLIVDLRRLIKNGMETKRRF